MKQGEKIRVKITQEVGTILEIIGNKIKIYIPKRGTFTYSKNLLEPIDRVPKSDCIDNSH